LNPYAYPENPMSWVDPLGLENGPAVRAMSRSRPCATRILEAANKLNNQSKYSTDSDYGFGAEKNKCNLLVHDVLKDAKVKSPQRTRFGIARGPITAGTWADAKTDIEGFSVVSTPQPGDIVAIEYPYSDATGHVAIVNEVGEKNNSIGASTEVGSHTSTWPWDGTSPPQGTPVYRRCKD
jgi:hypothetical protein